MPEIDSIIARNIGLLEGALSHANNRMDTALGCAVREIFNEKRIAFGWAGIVGKDFDEEMWVAPSEWHTKKRVKRSTTYMLSLLEQVRLPHGCPTSPAFWGQRYIFL